MRTLPVFERKPRGFTLIELLVVIAIIAILAAILFPVFAKAREKARQTTCLNNQKQINVAIMMWVQDHDETFPVASTWVTDMASTYGVTGKVWDCPTTSFKGTESAPDYFYVGGSFLSSAALGDVKDPAAAPLTADLASPKDNSPYIKDTDNPNDVNLAVSTVDKTRHNNGAVFSFVDGHTAWLAKETIIPTMFIPSITDYTPMKYPVACGELLPATVSMSSNSWTSAAAALGMTELIGG
ncbi:MAG TPA: prepilin-type N-terminal cleavage/methylation domain-containing protein, partial [Armatimonadota bacterium]